MSIAPWQAAIMIYALGAIVFTAYTLYCFRVLRQNEDAESREITREYDGIRDRSGLRDSGMAVFAGLIWPVLFVQYLRG